MSAEMKAGVICGALVGIVLVWFILKWVRGDGSTKCKFDERQERVRGIGFKYAFFTLLIYDGAYALTGMLLEKMPFDHTTGMFMGICISVFVYAAYCIWNEGYLALNEKPVRVMVAFTLIGIFNLIIGIHNMIAGKMLVDGQVTFHSINLLCAALFVAIGVIYLLKWMKDIREVE